MTVPVAAPDEARPGPAGLTAAEATRRAGECGANEVVTRSPVGVGRRVGRQLADPLVVVLLLAAALTIATGDHPDAVIILFVVVANTVVGVVQEVRADAAVAALAAMTAPTTRVRRDGVARLVDARTVVPGDVLELAEGDIVPADARVHESAALVVDESVLTGESVPVDKAATDGEAGALWAGTVVVHGRALAVVTAIGPASAMGRIAVMLDTRRSATPLQRRLVSLGRWIAGVGAAVCLVVMVTGLVRGQPLELMFVTAVSLLVAAVPESLPAVVTLALALGAHRMSLRHAIVRRLPAVETLGSVTVLASDKTGTLTRGDMVVERVWTPDGEVAISGTGYAPSGELDPAGGPQVRELLRAVVLCNDARLVPPADPDGEWSILGDPTEGALLAAAGKAGVWREEMERLRPRVDELPFDSVRRRMTTVHRAQPDDGRLLVVCKGAPDAMTPLLVRDGSVVPAHDRAAALAAAGYRVLAVAAGLRPGPPPAGPGARPAAYEHDLTLLGLLALADPPRQAAAATVVACRDAGIVPLIITGDHAATARAVAIRLGIIGDGDPVVTGAVTDAEGIPDPHDVRVYARTSPEQKLRLLQAWQQRGHVVAMTGDGVNDGPALHAADIGIAMGSRGTEVARQAADLVLADDDLGTVVAAVEEGRRVYSNVRRFLLYGLSGGLAEILVMLLGPAAGLALPLLPAQILWINLLTHGLPGVAFGAEPSAPDAMHRRPRPPAETVLGDGLWQRIARTGTAIAAVTLTVGAWAVASGAEPRTPVFLTLSAAQLAVALGVRAPAERHSRSWLTWAVAAAVLLQLAGVYVPALQALLGTRTPTAGELGVVAPAALLCYLLARWDRRRTARRHALPGDRWNGER